MTHECDEHGDWEELSGRIGCSTAQRAHRRCAAWVKEERNLDKRIAPIEA